MGPVPLGDRARAMAGREAGQTNHVGELAPGTGNDSMDEEQPVKGAREPTQELLAVRSIYGQNEMLFYLA